MKIKKMNLVFNENIINCKVGEVEIPNNSVFFYLGWNDKSGKKIPEFNEETFS